MRVDCGGGGGDGDDGGGRGHVDGDPRGLQAHRLAF